MKVAIAGFQHETNRSTPIPTTFEDFVIEDGWPGLTEGERMLEIFKSANIPLGGFLDFADKRGIDVHPILWASAEPAGLVRDDAFERIAAKILAGLDAAGTYDGIYLDLHGAMVCDSYEDGEGELLRRVRTHVGFEVPIAMSLDLHANITEEMANLTDVIAVYRTYPHIDMAATGFRAGGLLHQIVEAGEKPYAGFRKLPFIMPLHTQCTELEPARTLYEKLPDSNSLHTEHADIGLGFPPSDIAQIGPVIVTYSFSKSRCEDAADILFDEFLAAESLFSLPFYSPNEAIRLAKDRYDGKQPVVLADIQDNSGAGSSSDSTDLLAALAGSSVRNCAIGAIFDQDAVKAAHEAGIGGEFNCQIGDNYSARKNAGFHGRFKVAALSDGVFEYHGEMMAGVIANIGDSAALDLLDTDSEIRIVVTSTRIQCLDQAILSHVGVRPEEKAILAIKSTVHFRADFAPIASDIILVEAEGGFLPCRFDRSLFPRLRDGVRLL